MTTQPEDGPEIEERVVPQGLLDEAKELYTADRLIEKKPRLKGVFHFDGRAWACTGGIGQGQRNVEAHLYELVPADQWRGRTKQRPAGKPGEYYTGLKIGTWVFSDRQLRLVLASNPQPPEEPTMQAPSIARVSKVKPTRQKLPPASESGFSLEDDEDESPEVEQRVVPQGIRPPDSPGQFGGRKIDVAIREAQKMFPNLRIEKEFEALSLAWSDEEEELLAAMIKAAGCRDALLVWHDPETGHDLLVDGHRRLRICMRLSRPFRIEQLDAPDRATALALCRDMQLARRNLTDAQKSYLRGNAYLAEKKEVGRGEKKRKTNGASVSPLPRQDETPHAAAGYSKVPAPAVKPISTAEKIARQTGVSARTIKRDAKFATEVEKLPAEEKAQALSGKVAKSTVVTPGLQTGKKPAKPKAATPAEPLFEVQGKPSLDNWRHDFLRWALIQELRNKRPKLDELEACVDALHVFLCDGWIDVVEASRGARDESLLAQFFGVLPRAGLEQFAKQAGIYVPPKMTAAQLINVLWTKVDLGSLPLPECLKVGKAKKSGAKTSGGKRGRSRLGGFTFRLEHLDPPVAAE